MQEQSSPHMMNQLFCQGVILSQETRRASSEVMAKKIPELADWKRSEDLRRNLQRLLKRGRQRFAVASFFSFSKQIQVLVLQEKGCLKSKVSLSEKEKAAEKNRKQI